MSGHRHRGAGSAEPAVPLAANARPTLVVVSLLCAAGLLAQLAGGGGDSSAAAATDEVRTTALACPAAAVTGTGVESAVTLAVPPRAPDNGAEPVATPDPTATPAPEVAPEIAPEGSALLSDLGGSRVRARLGEAGAASIDVGKDSVPAQLARGSGVLAPGLAAELLTQARSGPGRGLAATSCVQPGTRFWFVGASTAGGRRDRLVLTNADDTPALVDLLFWGEKGAAEVPNSSDISVPANSVREIPLDGMSAGHKRLALGVTATRGRVAAALHDQDAPGIDSHGVDWIAPAAEAGRTVVIAGVPDGKLGRRLQLFAPAADAMVKVRLLTADNDFAPAGADTLELAAGRVAEFDLGPAADTQAAGIVITSDQPVAAAVRVTRTSGPVTDVAYATAAEPLTAPATVPDGRAGDAGWTRLFLTAPDGPASVTVRSTPGTGTGTGTGTEKIVQIPAGRTIKVDPTPSGATRYSVVVTPNPGSAPVYGARVLRSGATDVTIVPLRSGRFTVVIPSVVADVTATTRR